MTDDPHAAQPVERAGAALEDATAAVILAHGRGARARGMLDIANEIDRDDVRESRRDSRAGRDASISDAVAFLAPQAARGTWYPQSFLAPIEANEPHLTSALSKLESVLETVESAGIPPERTILLGFSQGACLSSEFVARNARRYGGLVALSGGVIGPDGTPREYEGSLDGTPAFFGCSDRDPHIPLERVRESVAVFEALEADVTERIYEGMGHTINEDELAFTRELVEEVAADSDR